LGLGFRVYPRGEHLLRLLWPERVPAGHQYVLQILAVDVPFALGVERAERTHDLLLVVTRVLGRRAGHARAGTL